MYGVAGRGRGVEHEVAIPGVELQVVEVGDGLERALEEGLLGDICDAAAVQVDAGPHTPQRLNVLLARPGWHIVLVSSSLSRRVRSVVWPCPMGMGQGALAL